VNLAITQPGLADAGSVPATPTLELHPGIYDPSVNSLISPSRQAKPSNETPMKLGISALGFCLVYHRLSCRARTIGAQSRGSGPANPEIIIMCFFGHRPARTKNRILPPQKSHREHLPRFPWPQSEEQSSRLTQRNPILAGSLSYLKYLMDRRES
jgi:hypothetical protein